ncbi:MAG: VOC family protein [Candidatus Zixiibacteriota bacterium]
MAGTLCHFEISTKDPAKAEKFYTDLFGWKITHDMGDDYLFVNTGQEPSGALGKSDNIKLGDNINMYFQVDDCTAYLKKAVSLGATLVKAKTEIPGHGWYGLFTDLDGNSIGLFEALKK